MAILQAEANASNGYFAESISTLQSDTFASAGNPINSFLTCQAIAIAAMSLQQSGLVFFSAYPANSMGKYQDYQSSFARFFGANAYQTNSFLYIKKSDIGVKKLSNSTAESILIGIIIRVLQEESNSLISNVYISLFRRYIKPGNQPLVVTNLVINLYMKILYEAGNSELLGNVMTNYTTVITPNQFNN